VLDTFGVMTSYTVGIPRSSWIIALVTYHGASTVARSILDWHLCMVAVLDLQAQSYNSMPLVHVGVKRDLYSTIVLPTERGDDLPSNQ